MDNTTPDRLIADSTGSDFNPASYDIAPEDEELAASLAAFDPLATPSPVTLTGGGSFKTPERFTLSILSADKQGPIVSQLAAVPNHLRPQREHELVIEALKQNSIELRVKAGAGAGATPLERERFQIAREVYDLESEARTVTEQLGEVEKWVPVFNEVTGEPVIDERTGQQQVVAVNAIKGDRRRAMEARIVEITHQIDLLDGFEGDRRLQRALKASVEARKAVQQQLDEEAEARRLADQINRDERVKARAETYAKNRRHVL